MYGTCIGWYCIANSVSMLKLEKRIKIAARLPPALGRSLSWVFCLIEPIASPVYCDKFGHFWQQKAGQGEEQGEDRATKPARQVEIQGVRVGGVKGSKLAQGHMQLQRASETPTGVCHMINLWLSAWMVPSAWMTLNGVAYKVNSLLGALNASQTKRRSGEFSMQNPIINESHFAKQTCCSMDSENLKICMPTTSYVSLYHEGVHRVLHEFAEYSS